MPVSYAKNKIHIQKWRENNREAYRELDRKHHRKSYQWKKIKMEFLAILL